ncbi:hypothetical protein VOI32_00835 [Paraburkholderia caribensis]|uniref:Dehydratase n=1 Tax=Paraburkholderia caribensis TaxID=75105 RepID=A0A9Q6WKU1_9BURK|nr:hypothetical protein [Paraburkholderia caribensis]MCO4875574.1 hypothetical protein [Paraburkholderia caribensis]PTB30507.1 hypothetical protein C9I56_01805 [Paraburkholderia caribensis]QLB62252.1 hypothetical protein A9O66_07580 [Paraburkholderia caribensis]
MYHHLPGKEMSDTDFAHLLPYGPSFLFVDGIVTFEQGRRIVTWTDWSRRPDILAAHFRDGPAIVPGALLLEQVAQSALLLRRLSHERDGALYLGRAMCSFMMPVSGGALLETAVALDVPAPMGMGLRGTIISDGVTVARFTLAVAHAPASATGQPTGHQASS